MEAVEQLKQILRPELGETRIAHREAIEKLGTGEFLRAHDAQEHFCVMFLPFDPTTRQVLVVHHKKAGLWLFPGGHIELGESPVQAVNREIQEELGLSSGFPETTNPFMFSVTSGIHNVGRACTTHYDVWFLLSAEGSTIRVDEEEVWESRWADLDAARALIHDRACLSALTRIQRLFPPAE